MIIEIEEFSFNTIIGILDFERITPQKVVLNIKIEYEYTNGEYINYAYICELIEDRMQTKKFELLEEALLDLKELLFYKFPTIKTLFIKIAKPDILDNAIVSLSNSWHKD